MFAYLLFYTLISTGHKYASVQYSFECFCGDKYGSYGKLPESRCDKRCPGKTSGGKKCGGTWAQNIYGTGLEGWFSLD